jgi:solute carrier family 50 protein (sugar transporter)
MENGQQDTSIGFFVIIQTGCVLATICAFLSPMPAFIEGLKRKELKNLSFNFILIGLLNGMLWTAYGLNLGDKTVIIANTVCAILYTFYVTSFIYINFSQNLQEQMQAMIKDIIIYNTLSIVVFFLALKVLPVNIVGLMATCIVFCMFTTMFEKIRETLIKKDPAYMNLLLAAVFISASILWVIYGIKQRDYFLALPNAYGLLMNSLNLIVYFWACGKIPDDNPIIVFLKKILKVEQDGFKLMNENKNVKEKLTDDY